jgi:hypothetical protein
MVLADGMTRGSVANLASSVRAVENSGTTVIGIGIGDHTVDEAYQRHQVVNEPQHLAAAMIRGTKRALRKSLSTQGMDTWWLSSTDSKQTQERTVA